MWLSPTLLLLVVVISAIFPKYSLNCLSSEISWLFFSYNLLMKLLDWLDLILTIYSLAYTTENKNIDNIIIKNLLFYKIIVLNI